MNVEQETYKGLSLFNDVEDAALRAFNRGTVLANLAVDGREKGKNTLKPAAVKDILEYFRRIPKDERKPVLERFIANAKEQGFIVVGAR